MAEVDLAAWLREAAAELGVTGLDDAVLGPDAVEAILDLAGEAAHNVKRPAAPLAAFAVGLSIGAGGSLPDVQERAARVGALARRWAEEGRGES